MIAAAGSALAQKRCMGFPFRQIDTVIFDVDGTLIDSNAAHADTWAQALSEHGVPRDAAQIRPLIGMGSDKLLPTMGLEEGSPIGHAVARRKKELFAERLPRLQPTNGARALVAFLREHGKTLVIATSADEEEMDALLQQAGVGDLIPRRTSSDDAEHSKPDPDIVLAALRRSGARPGATVMIGDTPFDIEAARRARVDPIALRCGGHWGERDLGAAIAIFDDPADLLLHWKRTEAAAGDSISSKVRARREASR
jgi:HAD superfamily hydrolase (TIGR01509 family)